MKTLNLNDTDPMTTFLAAQAVDPSCFFFESAPQIGAPAQTSVIGFGPFQTLRDVYGRAEVDGEIIEGSFFAVLAQKIKDIQVELPATSRFGKGGVFGCIGYDMISELEPKLKTSGDGKPESAAEVRLARTLIVFNHKAQTIELIEARPELTEVERQQRIEQLQSCLKSCVPSGQPTTQTFPELEGSRLKATMGFAHFSANLKHIKAHIREGNLFQAVLAERFECQTSASALDIFRQLRVISPSPYSFYLPFKHRTFFGASPETLVRVNGRRALAHPIAGTRPRGVTSIEDRRLERQLRRSSKEAAEHLMLVDLARNDLGRVAEAGSVRMNSYRKLHHLSHVMHLVSEVESELRQDLGALDAFKACFPAGTLSGAPKFRAMQILFEIETQPRGFYGGAVVAFDGQGGLDSCIAIRSLEMQGQTAILRAGAGIVSDSTAAREYGEIEHKLKTLRLAIGCAEGLS